MNLNDREWKEFLFPDIFEIKNGFYNKKPTAEKDGNIPFIGAIDNHNGVSQFNTKASIDLSSKTGDKNNASLDKKIFKGNCIVVTNNGSVGYAYYQKHSFTCSHDVNPLYLKNRILTQNLAYFLIGVIEQQRVCFSYVHKWRPKRMKKSKLLLPINTEGKPDFDFMEEFMREKEKLKIKQYLEYCEDKLKTLQYKEIKPLNEKQWHSFFITDIFNNIQRGKRLKNEDHIEGSIPYTSSSSLNNGINDFISNDKNVRKFKDCLSLANSGSVGSCFYEPFEFVASDHITHLKNDNFNEYHYLFVATMIKRLSQKYNFNREISDKRIAREKVLLPVLDEDNNQPDYEYMEQYVKNVMYKKYSDYLNYNK